MSMSNTPYLYHNILLIHCDPCPTLKILRLDFHITIILKSYQDKFILRWFLMLAISSQLVESKFDELILSKFPGQDALSLSTLVLKYIKNIIDVYNLHTKLETKVLIKVQ